MTFVERDGQTARPAVEQKGLSLHLPIWAFRVQYILQWEDVQRESLARQVPLVEWVYVTGFELHNASYFGDPGLIFTERRVRLDPGPPTPLAGCTRGLEEAKAYVETHLLRIIDRRVDVTGLELSCSISAARLWGVPYADGGDVLQDGILGLKIPAAAVDEVAAMRQLLSEAG
ncbi:MAG TPA: hypothetical protein VLM91_26205 [Candidatus Methylomirabilis sp.]|nr:hypothetical protein [Candidatus Methylomirabilis sp.]